ncbi:uncharacterized protein LOC115883267 [Sitophilus oryzae]|uniref:Uncharacterized protein LOC115883267 n=1 Tax=Sitophilus oryzae TaxID=7048 RepID=A0A6J2Y181_SITOR|nr:uncharacterized protein LOC115883267 [Sitophilus oryzae]
MLVEENFCKTTVLLDSGHFQVDLPLKGPNANGTLGESFDFARKRFYQLEKRFEKNPDLFLQYKKFIDEYISLNHARIVPLSMKSDQNENKYFFPHHCVIRNDSKSSKLRVVFDGSLKTSSGLSLNDIMYKGYTVQPDLYDILLRFRTFKYVITSDIEKMYRQVRINPKHTYLHNILWREKPCEKLQCIELSTVTYGTNCAPYLATRVLKELAVINQKTFPLASNALLSQCYVDDILCGQDSYENLVELHRQLMQLCKLGNFHLHKWCSNSNSLLNNINHSHKSDISQENYDIKVDGISNKVLGIFWNPNLDVFSISLPIPSEEKQVTKREVLSKIAQMFDPLGLIGPVIVIGKLMMQEIWKTKIDWDDFLEKIFL